MDNFWGGDLPFAKLLAGKMVSEKEIGGMDRQWVRSFRQKVKSIGYECQDENDPLFTNEKESCLYHLLFFSKHNAGLTIWRNIKRIEPGGQRTLPYFS